MSISKFDMDLLELQSIVREIKKNVSKLKNTFELTEESIIKLRCNPTP